MKRKYYFICLFILFTSSMTMVRAQSISISKATDIGVRFFEQATANLPRYAPARTIGENMTTVRALRHVNRDCMYVVSMPDSGWVLVSGDERVVPILAVSYDGHFPIEEDMPPAMRNLLEGYANAIIFVQDSISDVVEPHPQWEVLENNTYATQTFDAGTGSDIYTPGTGLLNRPHRGEVKWNQSWDNDTTCINPYNKYCPNWHTPSCNRTYVGCTAVAMAQIMWYWQWPHTAYIHDDIETNGDPKGNKTLHLYNWKLMPRELTSTSSREEADMVAGFLRDCGYASKMKYKIDGSSASLENARLALKNTFAYECEDDVQNRGILTNRWAKKLREEINEGRPILYAGYNPTSGHAFVVDGYNASDPNLFHINWGWGRANSGYYSLDCLCPPNHNYNDDQEALLGIQPAPLCEPYNTNGNDDNIRYGTQGALTVDIPIESGKIGAYYSGTSVTLKPGFHAKAGSKVHVAIQHFPCDGIAPASLRAPQHHQGGGEKGEESTSEDIIISEMTISPNPVQDVLQITSSEPIEAVAIYTLSGEKVLQATTTQVDVSNLKEGMYIVHITSQTGSHYTAKIVKQ